MGRLPLRARVSHVLLDQAIQYRTDRLHALPTQLRDYLSLAPEMLPRLRVLAAHLALGRVLGAFHHGLGLCVGRCLREPAIHEVLRMMLDWFGSVDVILLLARFRACGGESIT